MILYLLSTLSSFAGGYYYADSGIVAMSRGGAYFAGAHDQYAQRYNPAGIIRIERPTLNFGVSAVQKKLRWNRLLEDGEFAGEIRNQAGPFLIPEIGFSMPLSEKFAFAFGLNSPWSPKIGYDADGAQRYSIIHSSIYQFSVGPSIAYRPIPQLTIGLSVFNETLTLEQSLIVSTTGTDSQSGDVRVDISAADAFSPSGNIGILIEPIPQISIGARFKPQTQYKLNGHIGMDLDGNSLGSFLDNPRLRDGNCDKDPQATCTDPDGIDIELVLPMILGAGVAVRPVKQLEIELAFQWEDWSRLQDIDIKNVNATLDLPFGEQELPNSFTIPEGLRDTFSFRLGTEIRSLDSVHFRLGGMYETGGYTEKNISMKLADSDKMLFSGGASVFVGPNLRLDPTFVFINYPGLNLRNSESRQIYAGLSEDAEGIVIGNGDLKQVVYTFALGASWAFGAKKDD